MSWHQTWADQWIYPTWALDWGSKRSAADPCPVFLVSMISVTLARTCLQSEFQFTSKHNFKERNHVEPCIWDEFFHLGSKLLAIVGKVQNGTFWGKNPSCTSHIMQHMHIMQQMQFISNVCWNSHWWPYWWLQLLLSRWWRQQLSCVFDWRCSACTRCKYFTSLAWNASVCDVYTNYAQYAQYANYTQHPKYTHTYRA